MIEERTGHTNGRPHAGHWRRARKAEPTDVAPLGDVLRDVMDHASIIMRDELKLVRLEARRYTEHLKSEVAARALLTAGAAVCALLTALFGLIAVFLGIARALGSVAWAFAIYAVLFAAGTAVMLGVRARRATLGGEEILGRLPGVRAHEPEREHALVQQETPEAHRVLTEEARREAQSSR